MNAPKPAWMFRPVVALVLIRAPTKIEHGVVRHVADAHGGVQAIHDRALDLGADQGCVVKGLNRDRGILFFQPLETLQHFGALELGLIGCFTGEQADHVGVWVQLGAQLGGQPKAHGQRGRDRNDEECEFACHGELRARSGGGLQARLPQVVELDKVFECGFALGEFPAQRFG